MTEQQRRVRSRLEDHLESATLAVHHHPRSVPAAGDDALYCEYTDVRA